MITQGRKNALAREYKGISTLNGGPGGWKCPCCCNPYSVKPSRMKAKAYRLVRRKQKQALISPEG